MNPHAVGGDSGEKAVETVAAGNRLMRLDAPAARRYAVRPDAVRLIREMESDSPRAGESRIRLSLPVTVLMERHVIARAFWSVPSWRLTGVVIGEGVAGDAGRGRKIRDLADAGEAWSWSGYTVTLYKDACQRYWHALIGDKPLVYVICREAVDDISPLQPLVVSVDYDEASAHAETDELVLSAPIPGDLYRYMEAFVLEHYRPEKFEKRKRRKWKAESDAHHAGAADGKPRR